MRGVLASMAAVLAVVAAPQAFAADPMLDPVPGHHGAAGNWSGVYGGLNVGWVWGQGNWILDTPFPNPQVIVTNDISGIFAGGHVGAQHQFGNFVLGVEAAGHAANISGTIVSDVVDDRERSTEISSIKTIAARFGVAWDHMLVYGRAGYALGKIDTIATDTGSPPDGVGCGGISPCTTNFGTGHAHGWNLGAGIETRVADNIVLGLQYDYIKLNGKDRPDVNINGYGQADHIEVSADIHQVMGRVSLLFNSW